MEKIEGLCAGAVSLVGIKLDFNPPYSANAKVSHLQSIRVNGEFTPVFAGA
jgi:hypothetical protein